MIRGEYRDSDTARGVRWSRPLSRESAAAGTTVLRFPQIGAAVAIALPTMFSSRTSRIHGVVLIAGVGAAAATESVSSRLYTGGEGTIVHILCYLDDLGLFLHWRSCGSWVRLSIESPVDR